MIPLGKFNINTLLFDIWFTLTIVYKMCFIVFFFFYLSIQFRIIHCIELLHFFTIFSSRAWLSSHYFLSFITLTCFKRTRPVVLVSSISQSHEGNE